MAIGEGTFSLVVGGLPISVFSRLLPSALTDGTNAGGLEGLMPRLPGPRVSAFRTPALAGKTPPERLAELRISPVAGVLRSA
jgi:hypothetical protein